MRPTWNPSKSPFVLLLATFASWMIGCSREPDSGVISTGNAGRIQGKTVFDNRGVQVSARLVLVRPGNDSLVDSLGTDTAGLFEFRDVRNGTYRVEAWREGRLQGRSGEFSVDQNLVKDILVVLVQPLHFLVDLSRIGDVDSVFLDYPGNPAYRQGEVWSIQGLKGANGTLFTRLKNPDGVATWLSWEVRSVGDSLRIVGAASAPDAPFIRRIDTSAFFLTPHTVALWSFDKVEQNGTILDLSGNGNHLSVPDGIRLQPSPHGSALLARSLRANAPASTASPLPATLRWSRTGTQTTELRVKLDSFSFDGYLLTSSYIGPRIGVSSSGGIGIYHQIQTATGNAWFGFISKPNMLPVDRWLDISVGLDQARGEFYLWLDGRPVQLYPNADTENMGLVVDSTSPLYVGGGPWDARIGPVQIDEISISDTLVFGRGPGTLSVFTGVYGTRSFGVTANSSCGACATFPIGSTPASNSGYLVLHPQIPQLRQGNEVVQARIFVWATDASENRVYQMHRMLISPTEFAAKKSPPVAGVDFEALPFCRGTLQANSRGGIPFDVSLAATEWFADPQSAKGVLIMAADGSAPPISVYTSADGTSPPELDIQYR